MEDITKKLFVQTPVLLIGATLLIIGALGYWPFSDPPLQIQGPIINWILIMVGFLSMGSGIVELRHLRKAELDELQLTRFQKELILKSEALTSQQELQKMQEEYFKQQHGQISRQLEEIKSELLDKNENLTELREQYALTLLHQKVVLQIAKQESERIFEEYSDNYWSLYQILGQEGLIDLNISIEEVQDLDEGSLQKLLLLQFRNAFGLKSMLTLSELFKEAGLNLVPYQ
jgi:hypothetical protein